MLRSVAGLEAIDHIGRRLAIASNRSLPQCEAERVAMALEASGALDGSARVAANDETATCD